MFNYYYYYRFSQYLLDVNYYFIFIHCNKMTALRKFIIINLIGLDECQLTRQLAIWVTNDSSNELIRILIVIVGKEFLFYALAELDKIWMMFNKVAELSVMIREGSGDHGE
jgi:hypothetical protein